MVLSILVIILVGVIAYFHFAQGFFSATMSAIAAVLAAVLAVGYDENLVHLLLHGTGADNIHAIALVMLFVVAYTALRMIFDKAIPGNVRVPATVNYIGAALMGLVAGTFCVGVFVIALQMLPFGPGISLFGYSRFPLLPERKDVTLKVAGNGQMLDSTVTDQVQPDTLDVEGETGGLWLPADDLVLRTVAHLSDGGALAGSQRLTSVHPDWLGELFGQRIGIQPGTRHVALALPTNDPVSVVGVYAPASLPAIDGYGKEDAKEDRTRAIHPPEYRFPYKDGHVKAGGGLVPLVVRLKVSPTVTDDDGHLFRFSGGSIRLVARKPDDSGGFQPGTDFHPIGTLDDGKTVVVTRPDDFLFLNTGASGGFDAVFMVDPSVLVSGARGAARKVAPGTFLEVNRLAVLDLSDLPAGDAVPADQKFQVMRNDVFQQDLHPDRPNTEGSR